MKKNSKNKTTDFLFEVGMLAKTPRSGFFFLGSGEQSVAEHVNRVCYVGFALASVAKNVDISKVLQMCLFHDLTETRISDLNYIHQKYTIRDENCAIQDLTFGLPFGKKICDIVTEYEAKKTYESILAKDADQIEQMLSLKEQIDIGNTRAKTWIPPLIKRLKTKEAKALVKNITNTDSDNWWFKNKNDDWWVNRKKK